MRNSVRRRLRLLCVVGIATVLMLLLFGASQGIYWVGQTDLTVEFVITDADTGKPIEGAGITVHSYGGFYAETEEKGIPTPHRTRRRCALRVP